MAAVHVDLSRVHEFVDATSFERWLEQHHATEPEVWIKLHKVGSDLPSITAKAAIDVALCWGWIDAIRKSFDERSFLQRYTPRGKRSVWSQINVDNVARLIAAGRMTAHGLAHVEAAQADGRWARAYVAGGAFPIPDDLQAAIDAEPQARAMLATLSAQNRFALAFRVHNMKTDAGRRRKIESFVAMLKRGETIYPQGRKSVISPTDGGAQGAES
ncbi:MAG TPA: YdeI/OmpD-associated family protein [Polyangia bacterium]